MCLPRAFAKFAPRSLSIGEFYRYGASVGFCGATTEVIRAPPFEIDRVGTSRCEVRGRRQRGIPTRSKVESSRGA